MRHGSLVYIIFTAVCFCRKPDYSTQRKKEKKWHTLILKYNKVILIIFLHIKEKYKNSLVLDIFR